MVVDRTNPCLSATIAPILDHTKVSAFSSAENGAFLAEKWAELSGEGR
jgi:hypothetical protein